MLLLGPSVRILLISHCKLTRVGVVTVGVLMERVRVMGFRWREGITINPIFVEVY